MTNLPCSMRLFIFARKVLIGLLLVTLTQNTVWARDANQQKRIDYLLQSIEHLQGAGFIRNGSEYNSADAGKHLRLKLKNGGERVKTAEDFIEGCASHSSYSGKPYLIRMPDGTTTECAAFLNSKLHEFDHLAK